MFDGSAAKLGEDVIAAVQKETDALAAKQAEAQPAPEETVAPDAAEKKQLLDFLAAAPEAEGDPYADQPTVTAPELPMLNSRDVNNSLSSFRRPMFSCPLPT